MLYICIPHYVVVSEWLFLKYHKYVILHTSSHLKCYHALQVDISIPEIEQQNYCNNWISDDSVKLHLDG